VTADSDANVGTIRVVIAEDQAPVRRETALLLSIAPDMECVGQACNGEEAVKLASVLRPDVVLMDLHMPVKNGVAATREIMLADPSIQVLILSTLDDDETIFEAVRAGAQAYLLKDTSEDELLETIRALRRGESRLTPQIARKMMDQFRRLSRSRDSWLQPTGESSAGQVHSVVLKDHGASPREELSDKEERVLSLITEGSSNRQIAHSMSLTEGAIKNYVSRIMQKLHANTRTERAILTNRENRDG
jgi:DNA-binding NarL/FixJ family response regulator